MDMLLRYVNTDDLLCIFRQHPNLSPVPELCDPKIVAKARRLAQSNGTWDDLGQQMEKAPELKPLRHSSYRMFNRTGNRKIWENEWSPWSQRLRLYYEAAWLGHPGLDMTAFHDLLWATCDQHTWVMSAHQSRQIDLGASMTAVLLAQIVHVLGDRIDAEVQTRIRREIERRIFDLHWSWKNASDSWETGRSNWNHVCNGNILQMALLLIDDPAIRARMVHRDAINLTYGLDGFTDDGGCTEGPGYWGYGFGHYVTAALALYNATNGQVNLMAHEKIERICRYPLAVYRQPGLYAPFSDVKTTSVSPTLALMINRFYNIPELYTLCPRDQQGRLLVTDKQGLALSDGNPLDKKLPKVLDQDAYLPQLQVVKLNGRPGRGQLTVFAKGGHNAECHNHNDVGQFVVMKDDVTLLTDPGACDYSQKTFSAHRYDIIFCNSRGHGVPLINGRQQAPGEQYAGTLSVTGLGTIGEKRATIEMAQAYPAGTVRRLTRTLTLDAPKNTMILEDVFELDHKPRQLEEAFITFLPARVLANGKAVKVGSGAKSLTLQALTSGRFTVERLEKESREAPSANTIVRIVFTPRQLDKKMTVRVVIQ